VSRDGEWHRSRATSRAWWIHDPIQILVTVTTGSTPRYVASLALALHCMTSSVEHHGRTLSIQTFWSARAEHQPTICYFARFVAKHDEANTTPAPLPHIRLDRTGPPEAYTQQDDRLGSLSMTSIHHLGGLVFNFSYRRTKTTFKVGGGATVSGVKTRMLCSRSSVGNNEITRIHTSIQSGCKDNQKAL
jgi:hypothetical protein